MSLYTDFDHHARRDAEGLFRAFVVGALIHALLIVGVGLSLQAFINAPSTVEVVATKREQLPPDEAFAAARYNNQGAGKDAEARHEQQMNAPLIASLKALSMAEKGSEQSEKHEGDDQQANAARPKRPRIIFTTAVNLDATTPVRLPRRVRRIVAPSPLSNLAQANTQPFSKNTALSNVSVEHYLRTQRNAPADAAALKRVEAAYIYAWIRKVERVGTAHYPVDSNGHPMAGSLVISVVVRADGTVERTIIPEGSHNFELDQKVYDIMQKSTPFSPFPAEMRTQYTAIQITKTWRFESGILGVAAP